MDNTNVAPIEHSTLSATAATVGGTAVGAAVGAVKGGATGFLAPIAVGAAILGIPALLIAAPLILTHFVLAAFIVGIPAVIGGAVGGGLLSMPLAGLGTLFGGLFGGAKGAMRAGNQVSQERGAASELNAQIEIAKAQAAAPIYAPAAENKFTLSSMNGAPSQITVGSDNTRYDGLVAGQQLATAR